MKTRFNSRFETVFAASVLVVIGVLGWLFVKHHSYIDFPVYYTAARSLLSGRTDLYAADFALSQAMDYRYPPLFILLFSPLGLLSYVWAAYVWFWICALSIGGVVFVAHRLIKKQFNLKSNDKKLIWTIVFFAVGQYFVMALHYGNVHLFFAFLQFLSFYYFALGKDARAALLLAAAITIKVVPLLTLPYFVVKKRWRLAILTVVFVLVFNLAPSFYFGFEKNTDLLVKWCEHVVLNQQVHERSSWINLSLKGQLQRYLTQIDYSQRAIGTGSTDINYPAVNLASLSPDLVNHLWLMLITTIYLSGLALIWRTTTTTTTSDSSVTDSHLTFEQKTVLLEYGFVVCLTLLVNPLTPKLYFLQLLLPVAFLAASALASNNKTIRKTLYIVFLIAALNFIFPLLPGSRIQRLLLVTGTDFYLTLLLLATFAHVLIVNRIESQSKA